MRDYGDYELDPMEGQGAPEPAPEDQTQPGLNMTVNDVSIPSYPPQLPRPLPPPLPMPRTVSPIMELLGRQGPAGRRGVR